MKKLISLIFIFFSLSNLSSTTNLLIPVTLNCNINVYESLEYIAAKNNNINTFNLLLSDRDKIDKEIWNALNLACHRGELHIVDLLSPVIISLWNNKANLSIAISIAIMSDNIEEKFKVCIIKKLLKQGANPNYIVIGKPLLVWAILNQCPNIVSLLFSHGADIQNLSQEVQKACIDVYNLKNKIKILE